MTDKSKHSESRVTLRLRLFLLGSDLLVYDSCLAFFTLKSNTSWEDCDCGDEVGKVPLLLPLLGGVTGLRLRVDVVARLLENDGCP